MNTSQREYFITVEEFLCTIPDNEFKEILEKCFDAETNTYKQEVFIFIYNYLWTVYKKKYAEDLKFDVIEMFCAFILRYNVDAPRHVREFTADLIIKSAELGMMDLKLGPRQPNKIRLYLLTRVGIKQEPLLSLFEFYFDLTEHLNVFATIDYVNLENNFQPDLSMDNDLGIKLERPVVVLLINDKVGTMDIIKANEKFTKILDNRLQKDFGKKHVFNGFFKKANIMWNKENKENLAIMMDNNSIKEISNEIVAREKTLIFIDTIFISAKYPKYNNLRSIELRPISFNNAEAFDFSLNLV